LRSGWRTSAALAAALVAACAGAPPAPPEPPPPRVEVLLLPDLDGSVGEVTVSNAGGEVTLDEAGEATAVRDAAAAPESPQTLDAAERERRFGAALAATPSPPAHFVLYFEQDSTDLTAASRELIPAIVAAVRERAPAEAAVVGHTDTLGDKQHNYELALRRAEAVAGLLTGAGIDPTHVETASHGEENLLVPTADEVAEPRNRRVEVTVR